MEQAAVAAATTVVAAPTAAATAAAAAAADATDATATVTTSDAIDAQPKSVRFFVATDEAEFLDYMLERHGGAVVFTKDACRTRTSTYKKGKTFCTHLLPHRGSGLHAVLDMYLLAGRCNHARFRQLFTCLPSIRRK
jgi:hypothetical protein